MPAPSVVVLAHPLTEQGELPVSALVMAIGAVYLFAMAAAFDGWRARSAGASPPRAPARHDDEPVPRERGRRVAFWAVRVVGLALFVLAVVAGLRGDISEVRNIAPALTVGAGWPALVVATLVLGGVWEWLNPYDTLARGVSALGAGDGAGVGEDGVWAPVWWAVVPAALWMMYLTVLPSALTPRSVGAALLAYLFVTLAGCLAVGRKTWLWRGEFFTIFFGLLTSVRRLRVRNGWPQGAPVLLGIVCGGALFGLVRDSDLGTLVAYGPTAVTYSRIAVAVSMVIAGGAAHLASRRAAHGSVTVALVPMAAALVLALSMARNRFTTSAQLLPIAASNPLGGELDLFGTRYNGLTPQPLGTVGPVWVQVGLLVTGAILGVVLARRWATWQAGGPGLRRTRGVVSLLLGTFLGVAVAAVAAI